MKIIENPFIKGSPVTHQKKISKEFLIEAYKEQLNIDIENILASCDSIDIYRCKESGFDFYYPPSIAGDSKFYESLQEYDWYYLPWKWEHGFCEKYIQENSTVLEVGCGKGAFIARVSSKFDNIKCVGLELNESAVCTNDRYKIVNSYVEDFAVDNRSMFDLVCSFQVLEHIPSVSSFLEASISCLKKDGLLVIAVPNNASFIKYNEVDILNMPPHHSGLWTEKSLRKIGEIYALDVVEVAYEPLQEYHFDYYTDLVVEKFVGKYLFKVFRKIINVVKLRNLIRKFLKLRANKIRGHSILIIFKKKS